MSPEGDKSGADRLLEQVYEELRKLADRRFAQLPAGQTLEPTALVHETYLRLLRDENAEWENRAHFFASAARAMRRIIIERARARGAIKRGGDRRKVAIEGLAISNPYDLDLIALDEALTKLNEQDPRLSDIITLRSFAGFSVEETARALEISPRTVVRELRLGRAWLYNEVSKGETGFAE